MTDEALEEMLRTLCLKHLPPHREYSADAGFFELGLTSRKLTAIVVELKEAGVPVSLIDLFRQENPAALARALSRRAAGSAARDRVPPAAAEPDDGLPWPG